MWYLFLICNTRKSPEHNIHHLKWNDEPVEYFLKIEWAQMHRTDSCSFVGRGKILVNTLWCRSTNFIEINTNHCLPLEGYAMCILTVRYGTENMQHRKH